MNAEPARIAEATKLITATQTVVFEQPRCLRLCVPRVESYWQVTNPEMWPVARRMLDSRRQRRSDSTYDPECATRHGT